MFIPPKFKEGDTIFWFCDADQRVHQSKVTFVSFVKVGENYIDVSYEIEEVINGEKKVMYINEEDAYDEDYSV